MSANSTLVLFTQNPTNGAWKRCAQPDILKENLWKEMQNGQQIEG